MSRPNSVKDLPPDKKSGPPIIAIDYSRINEFPAEILGRLYSLIGFLEEATLMHVYIHGKRESGGIVEYRRRFGPDELRSALEAAQAEWDKLCEAYNSAAKHTTPLPTTSPTTDMFYADRAQIDAWAHAEGRPPLDWEEVLK